MGLISTASVAKEASFGCKVLLCAVATAPSWSGIPYCVPVMQQLFRQLAKGGGWPPCPEGQTSGLGHEPYLPCPAGWTQSDSAIPRDETTAASSPNSSVCLDLSKPRRDCTSGSEGGCQTSYPSQSRQTRDEPYFVDITTGNGQQRFYFALRGY
ncbi:hypothetical protein QO058_30645 (plasmid) [Bosea vestrisii]|uniref:hypothetical protein n=1 Tax=Bosea vestrisii TaxID=151416 RepID=UPI0024DF5A63|nr:hypothetical protein [Bosea vestrisii]WID99754.1 hypothetical protein QO058_30645 [Bosea vestrisii]